MYNPWISTWFLVGPWWLPLTRDRPMFSMGNMSQGHKCQPLTLYNQGLRHGPQKWLRLGLYHGLRYQSSAPSLSLQFYLSS